MKDLEKNKIVIFCKQHVLQKMIKKINALEKSDLLINLIFQRKVMINKESMS